MLRYYTTATITVAAAVAANNDTSLLAQPSAVIVRY